MNLHLPPRLRARRKAGGRVWYYYDAGGKPRREIPLGNDYLAALKRYAELEGEATPGAGTLAVTFGAAARKYQIDVLRRKARSTARNQAYQLAKVLAFFDDPPSRFEQIRPQHGYQYLEWRADHPTAGLRELALASHIWTWSRAKGYTDRDNPFSRVAGEWMRINQVRLGRDVYIEDDVIAAVKACADLPTIEAMDLIYLSGQRPGDCTRMREVDLREGEVHVQIGKTRKRLRIAQLGEFGTLLERIGTRKRALKIAAMTLLVNERGQPLTQSALRGRFEDARSKAALTAPPELAARIRQFQLRDLRAKALTDKEDAEGLEAARAQAGHGDARTTMLYVRNRRGTKARPTR